jgi:hypothetical protein
MTHKLTEKQSYLLEEIVEGVMEIYADNKMFCNDKIETELRSEI